MAAKLYDFQQDAIDSVFEYFYAGNKGHPLIAAPTGSGKSHILAGLCATAVEKVPKVRILVLTHTKDIILQDAKIMREYLPPEKVGIYSAGLGARQLRQFTVASIQSIYKHSELCQDYSLVIVDEAHMIPPTGEGRYRTFLGGMDHVRVIGLTATPFRRGHGMLTEGHLFDKIVYEIPPQMLIDRGLLSTLTSKATSYTANVNGLKKTGGDYNKLALKHRLDRSAITANIADILKDFKDKRKAWLVFAIDIEHCEHIANELNNRGILAVAVHSKLDVDRTEVLDLFKRGRIQAVVSVETLTTGFDAPNIDLIALMRPTASPVLHVQMLGRGMRIAEDKEDCLVLDFAGNVQRLGPVDEVLVASKKTPKKGKGQMPTKVCPECNEIVSAVAKKCVACGYVFPVRAKLLLETKQEAVLKSQKKKEVLQDSTVSAVRYTKHKRSGKKPSLKVTYICGLTVFHSEWIAFEHTGYPRKKAINWWQARTNVRVPDTVEEALLNASYLRKPSSIRVLHTGKYPEIVRYDF